MQGHRHGRERWFGPHPLHPTTRQLLEVLDGAILDAPAAWSCAALVATKRVVGCKGASFRASPRKGFVLIPSPLSTIHGTEQGEGRCALCGRWEAFDKRGRCYVMFTFV